MDGKTILVLALIGAGLGLPFFPGGNAGPAPADPPLLRGREPLPDEPRGQLGGTPVLLRHEANTGRKGGRPLRGPGRTRGTTVGEPLRVRLRESTGAFPREAVLFLLDGGGAVLRGPVRADSGGEVSLSLPPAARRIRALARGCEAKTWRLPAPPRPRVLLLVLERAPLLLRARVFDAERPGGGLPGLLFELRIGDDSFLGLSGKDGALRIHGRSGRKGTGHSFRLVLDEPSWCQMLRDRNLPRIPVEETLPVPLLRWSSLRLDLREPDGAPVRKGEVWVSLDPGRLPGLPPSARIGFPENGLLFRLPGRVLHPVPADGVGWALFDPESKTRRLERIPPGLPLLLLFRRPGEELRRRPLRPLRPGETAKLRWTLPARHRESPRLTFLVLDEGGRPLPGAQVWRFLSEEREGDLFPADRNGRIEIPAGSAGGSRSDVSYCFRAEGRLPRVLHLHGEETGKLLRVRLLPNPAVSTFRILAPRKSDGKDPPILLEGTRLILRPSALPGEAWIPEPPLVLLLDAGGKARTAVLDPGREYEAVWTDGRRSHPLARIRPGRGERTFRLPRRFSAPP